MTVTPKEDLLVQIHQCSSLLHRGRIQRGNMGHSMHHGQGRVLSLLNKMDGASQTDLMRILDSRPASVSELVDKLEHLELVDRRRSRIDRRKVNLYITNKGKDAVAANKAVNCSVAANAFNDFTPEEVKQFSSLLEKLCKNLSSDLPSDEDKEDEALCGPA